MDLNLRPTRRYWAPISFEKAKKVIASCENEYHLKAARKYINAFFNCYSKSYMNKSSFRIFNPSKEVADFYNKLLHLLCKKELEILKDEL